MINKQAKKAFMRGAKAAQTARNGIAVAMFLIGFLLLFGAMGTLDFGGTMSGTEFLLRTGGGLLLMIAAFPTAGEFDA